jgi:RNA polymerase sigma-70 factor (ECF subfamily)
MDGEPKVTGPALEQFRPYLRLLAQLHLQPALQGKVDPSDLVQQTFLQAYRGLDGFRGQTSGELAAWLRQILARTLSHTMRDYGRARRDVDREQSLQVSLAASSAQLECWFACDQSPSPSKQAQFNEQALLLADALAQLPEAQRQALIWQHWQGWSLEEIGQKLGRSRAAVAGLIKRGLQQLRVHLGQQDEP